MSSQEEANPLRGKNMMNMAKNRAHRKMVERVLTQKVGDPSFAW